MTQTVFGAGGAIGIELAKALAGYNTEIRLVSRKPSKINATDHLFPADLTRKDEAFNRRCFLDRLALT